LAVSSIRDAAYHGNSGWRLDGDEAGRPGVGRWGVDAPGMALASEDPGRPAGGEPPPVVEVTGGQDEPMTSAVSCFPQVAGPTNVARILIVEDDPDSRRLLGNLLRRSGYECRLAADGQAALDQVADEVPDLILMDLMMPVLDGVEATRRLKADARTRAIPVVALTGNATPAGERAARGAGVDAFLTKPVIFPQLLAQLEAMLRGDGEA
jgi:CheY-like chemotaxis protein